MGKGQMHSSFDQNFLSTDSPWDFKGCLGTFKHNRVCPETRFANKSSRSGAIYCWKNEIPPNVWNQKNNTTFTLNTFWGHWFCFYESFWLFSQNHFWGISTFGRKFAAVPWPKTNTWSRQKCVMWISKKKKKYPKNGFYNKKVRSFPKSKSASLKKFLKQK